MTDAFGLTEEQRAETDEDLCACGVPWADVPIGHSRGIAFRLDGDPVDAPYSCSDTRPAKVEEFGADLKAGGDPADNG